MGKNFDEDEKIKRLLWCDRHCCICGKACGVDIEFAHIDPRAGNDIDNGIPVCYDCHSEMGKYNVKHPRGTKFKVKELKARREQIYEEYTRKLVPPIEYLITNIENPNKQIPVLRQYPDITFNVTNLSDYLPAKLVITLRGILNGSNVDLNLPPAHYTADKIWNLNPRNIVNGHFTIRNKRLENLRPNDRLEIKVKIRIIDKWDREHELLENGYIYVHTKGYWYFEP